MKKLMTSPSWTSILNALLEPHLSHLSDEFCIEFRQNVSNTPRLCRALPEEVINDGLHGMQTVPQLFGSPPN